jgi:hypothetical protein
MIWTPLKPRLAANRIWLRFRRGFLGLPGIAAASVTVLNVTATANWWEAGGATGCIAAYQAKGAASYAASKINLANPGTYDLTEGSAPSWATGTGWTFDGTTQYLKTGMMWGGTEAWTVLVQFSNAAANSSGMLTHVWDSNHWGLNPTEVNFCTWYRGGIYASGPAQTNANLGFAAGALYINGTNYSNIGTGTAPNYEIFVAAGSFRGNVYRWFSGNIQAAAYYSNTLTAAQVLAVSTAMAAL